MTNNTLVTPWSAFLPTVTLLALAACNQSAAAAATAPAAAAPAKGNYVLVTQRRPESPEKFFSRLHGVYDLCAASASLRHVVPKPFPPLPRDFVDSRITHARDGARLVVREVVYGLDFVGGKPNDTCAMRLTTRVDVTVTANGQEQTTHLDEDGQMTVDEAVPSTKESVLPLYMTSFMVARTFNGIPLKCGTAGACIVDPAVMLVTDGNRPLQVAALIGEAATYGTRFVLEPVSLAINKPVDPALFSVGKNK